MTAESTGAEIALITIGGSRYPDWPGLAHKSFAVSASGIQEAIIGAFAPSSVATLTLFDDGVESDSAAAAPALSPSDIASAINQFLQARPKVSDIILYFCGHGSEYNGSLCLHLNATKRDNEGLTGLLLGNLVKPLQEQLARRRIYLVLDCCFAGHAAKDLKSVYRSPLMGEFGLVLVGAVDGDSTANASSDNAPTLFSGHLIDLIRQGLPGKPDGLSFDDVVSHIRTSIADPTLKPVLDFTISRAGLEIARRPVIPNKASARLPIKEGGDQASLSQARRTLVVLSDSEATSQTKLVNAVSAASTLLQGDAKAATADVAIVLASQAVSSPDSLKAVIAALCRSEIAVFDGTGFEPAVMLLLGIRSVVRRGVTIISVGGSYTIGGALDIPFMIKDANVVSHSSAQSSPGRSTPAQLLASRIRQGFASYKSAHYADLPTFSAIRQVPPERREIIPQRDGFLVLCPFETNYVKMVWSQYLSTGLAHQLEALRLGDETRARLGVARSFELDSPRLVSQAVYEAIRRVHTCVVDWTLWSPNVFYEFGVRLSVTSNRRRTVAIIGVPFSKELSAQKEALLRLFDPIQYDPSQEWAGTLKTFDKMVPVEGDVSQSIRQGQLAPDEIYRAVQAALDGMSHSDSDRVEHQLLRDARYFERDSTDSSPASLFPESATLALLDAEAERERLLAVWAYLIHRWGEERVLSDDDLRRSCTQAVDGLLSRHFEALSHEIALRQQLESFQDKTLAIAREKRRSRR